jgi:carotenoid cleavage dioxygenase-like enzyme
VKEITMATGFRSGFATLDEEIALDQLPVRGRVPAWLKGTLVRNGPAKFEVGAQQYRHWFDGLAMLHKFSIEGGQVSYANKFLRSRAYTKAMATGKISYGEFATDPCRSIFSRIYTLFVPQTSDNGSVSVARFADRFVALTETTLPVEFEPRSLRTLGILDSEGGVPGQITTAHPHYDPGREAVVSYKTRISRFSSYNVYAMPRRGIRQTLIGSVSVPEPAYMHSFGMTERYVVLAEFPFFVSPFGLALKRKPYIGNARWKPERGARFLLMDRADGRVINTLQAEAFFAFHHVNAFEEDGAVVVDISAYPDTTIIDRLFLNRLAQPDGGALPYGELRRYRLPLNGSHADYERLSDEAIDLPRINYRQSNAHDYRYAYGIGIRKDRPDDFLNQLVKVDVRGRTASAWYEDGCYPGEPVFVAVPDAAAEDDGVVLSLVLDSNKDNSFLLILAAGSFEEVARATVPHRVPFGLHGQFFDDVLSNGIERSTPRQHAGNEGRAADAREVDGR